MDMFCLGSFVFWIGFLHAALVVLGSTGKLKSFGVHYNLALPPHRRHLAFCYPSIHTMQHFLLSLFTCILYHHRIAFLLQLSSTSHPLIITLNRISSFLLTASTSSHTIFIDHSVKSSLATTHWPLHPWIPVSSSGFLLFWLYRT